MLPLSVLFTPPLPNSITDKLIIPMFPSFRLLHHRSQNINTSSGQISMHPFPHHQHEGNEAYVDLTAPLQVKSLIGIVQICIPAKFK